MARIRVYQRPTDRRDRQPRVSDQWVQPHGLLALEAKLLEEVSCPTANYFAADATGRVLASTSTIG
jgi:hypothetical protein